MQLNAASGSRSLVLQAQALYLLRNALVLLCPLLPTAPGKAVVRLMIEILHDVVYQNVPNPRNCGSMVYIGSCRISIINSRKPRAMRV